jgi:hypothetical protein
LSGAEKALAAMLVVLGMLLIVGTLIWLGASTDSGSVISKETHTTEPVGAEANGQKTVDETEYAETLIVFALTIGAVMVLSGTFFGRIREIKFGTAALVLQAPKEEVEKAKKKAEEEAKAKAPEGKKDEAAAIAGQEAARQINVAYVTAAPEAKPVVADAVGAAAATVAVERVKQ